ncbi:carbohydrate esterase family 1 protein, partial [Cadophora sp. DSE1049]
QGIPGADRNDILFTQDILTSLPTTYALDTTRIFATGISRGGGFCGALACDPLMSTKIAAFVPVSGAFYVKNDTKCRPETINITFKAARQVPVIKIHGGEHHTIDYEREGRIR